MKKQLQTIDGSGGGKIRIEIVREKDTIKLILLFLKHVCVCLANNSMYNTNMREKNKQKLIYMNLSRCLLLSLILVTLFLIFAEALLRECNYGKRERERKRLFSVKRCKE